MELMEAYKQTDIGTIPFDWNVHTLKDIANYRRGSFPQPYGLSKWYDDVNGSPFVQVFDVSDNGLIKPETKRMISKDAQQHSVFAEKGTLILTIQGSIGRIAITQYDAFIDRTLLIFESYKLPIDIGYFSLIVKSLFKREEKNAPGGIIKTITKEALSSFLIALPPNKTEQTAIATALGDMDALITSLEKLIEKKKAIKQGAMQELLKPKEGWVDMTLGDSALFLKGKGLPKSELDEFGLYKCIHYGELFTKYKENVTEVYSATNNYLNKFYSLKNDVLMPTSDVTPNGLARASCIKFDNVILGGDILVIRIPEEVIEGVFLAYYITYNRVQVMGLVSGSTVFHLYGSDMSKFKMKLPPKIEDQRAIAAKLTNMDNAINVMECLLLKYKYLKQGMMQELLTGKTRLI